MSTIVTRAGKGSPLTNTEVDANFTNLNTDKAELSGATFTGEIVADAGIDVTGTATMDGLTVDGTAAVLVTDTDYFKIGHQTRGGDYRFTTSGTIAQDLTLGNGTQKLTKFSSNGDISFYEDTGTTPKFFWDASAESLGIGTSSPSSKLHLSGDGDSASKLTVQRTGASTGTSVLGYNYLGSFSNNDFKFFANSAEAMRIDASGRVLLNRTTSTGSLTLESQAPSGFSVGSGFYSGSTQSTIDFQDANTTANYKVRIGSETDDMIMFAGGAERMRIDSSGLVSIKNVAVPTLRLENTDDSLSAGQVVGALEFFSSDPSGKGPNVTGFIETRAADAVGAGGTMVFATGATGSSPEGERAIERMRIDSSGNVGIGTTTPSAKLELSSNNSAGTALNVLRFNDEDGTQAPSQPTGRIEFYHNDSSVGAGVASSITNISQGSTALGELHFATGSDSTAMMIDSSGNVGIGTSSVDSLLHLSKASGGSVIRLENPDIGLSDTEVVGKIEFETQDTGGAGVNSYIQAVGQGTGGANKLEFGTGTANSPSTRMVIDASGNVGIGTSSPTYDLDLTGAMRISESRSTYIDASEDPSAAAHIFTTNALVGDFTQEAGHLVLQARTHTSVYRDIIFAGGINDASDLMRITGEGNVGIGTSSPTQKLHVDAGEVLVKSAYDATGSTNSKIYFASRENGNWRNSYIGNTTSNLTFATGGTGTTHTNATERMRIDASGNVGIGGTPTAPLHVFGGGILGSSSTNPIAFTGSSSTNAGIGSYNANTDFNVYAAGTGAIKFRNAAIWNLSGQLTSVGAERMRIDASGNVGIGTTTPARELHISRSGQNGVRLTSTTFGADFGLLSSVSGQNGFGIYDYNASGYRFNIDSSGNVGIGTSSPTAKLTVSGTGVGAAIDWVNTTATTGRSYRWVSLNNGTGFAIEDLTDSTERMRIDASGNLLVGTTDVDHYATATNQGMSFRADFGGLIASTRSNNYSGVFNRIGTDGDILNFRKDGTTVGSIGSIAGQYLSIGTGDTGLAFDDDENHIIPWNMNTNGSTDGDVDLGDGARRFKDLYLSGGVYLGGTGAANKLEDYEEGTWTPTLGGGATATNMSGKYTKVGNLVTAYLVLENSTISGTPDYIVSGLPFTSIERTALSVTYYRTFNAACESLGGFVAGNGNTMQFVGMVQGGNWVTAPLTAGSTRYAFATAVYQTA